MPPASSRPEAADGKHAEIAERVRQTLAAMWADNGFANSDSADVTLARARKLQNSLASHSSSPSRGPSGPAAT